MSKIELEEVESVDDSTSVIVVCKNCETQFEGNYCPNCGQSVKDLDIPFKILIFDIMANMWAFDTRVLKTLKSVLFKPGEMALDYVAGKRARYMPPFRFYVFISFIFFLLLNLTTTRQFNEKWSFQTGSDTVTISKGDSDNNLISITDSNSNNSTFKGFTKDINQNKEYYISRFFSILSWSLFILMPLYAALFWVLFKKSQKHFLGHFIFAINQHAFLFTIFILLLIINSIFPEKSTNYESWLLLLFPIYIVVGSRKLYRREWLSIIMRITAAQFIYMFILGVAIIAVAYITFARVLTN
ncbi:MAG: DUF3667 domain-containing protein [Bacteroidales bacterium]|jgi:hypothetical protein|nr:DUF3667 domain-containing protein [Bacteroidales bacterium]